MPGGKIYSRTCLPRTGKKRVSKYCNITELMRTCVIPEKLNKYNDAIPDLCIRCEEEKVTFLDCVWECNKVQQFHREINNKL